MERQEIVPTGTRLLVCAACYRRRKQVAIWTSAGQWYGHPLCSECWNIEDARRSRQLEEHRKCTENCDAEK